MAEERTPEAAPELPPLPWQRAPQRQRARRRDPLTQDAIVEKALELLDAEGLDGLSMRKLAEEFDTGPASLYWHVGSKDGLLDLLLDRVIGEIEIPDPEPERWRDQLKEVARATRVTILSHRDVVRISIGRIPMGPNALRHSERVLGILRTGGVPDSLAVLGYLLLLAVINGFTIDETGEAPADQPSLEEGAQMAGNYLASLPPDAFPNLIALADQFTITDPELRFELLIDLFVEGLARRAEAGG